MNERLTGKIRYKVVRRLLSPDLVVLEVEVEWEDGSDDWHGMPEYLAGSGWRKARPEDLQYLK